MLKALSALLLLFISGCLMFAPIDFNRKPEKPKKQQQTVTCTQAS